MPTDARPIRSVIFDLDDTLFPERIYVRSGYAAVGRDLRGRVGRSEAFEEWLWDRFCAGRAANAFDALSEEFQLQFTPERIARLVSVYREHVPRIRPFEGIPKLLGGLHSQYRLGLLSDGFLPAQKLKLEALEIGRFFDAVVFTEEMGREFWKPSPRGFESIAELLDTSHECCAYVADNPAKDFVAPNALGWRTIQYVHADQVHANNPPPDGGEPQAIVRSPGELCEALL